MYLSIFDSGKLGGACPTMPARPPARPSLLNTRPHPANTHTWPTPTSAPTLKEKIDKL